MSALITCPPFPIQNFRPPDIFFNSKAAYYECKLCLFGEYTVVVGFRIYFRNGDTLVERHDLHPLVSSVGYPDMTALPLLRGRNVLQFKRNFNVAVEPRKVVFSYLLSASHILLERRKTGLQYYRQQLRALGKHLPCRAEIRQLHAAVAAKHDIVGRNVSVQYALRVNTYRRVDYPVRDICRLLRRNGADAVNIILERYTRYAMPKPPLPRTLPIRKLPISMLPVGRTILSGA